MHLLGRSAAVRGEPQHVAWPCRSTPGTLPIAGIGHHELVNNKPAGMRSGGLVPTLTLFCGLPGSGKSTLAGRLEADGRGVRLCTDDWQAMLGVDHADVAFHDQLQPVLYRHGLTLLRHGVDVILEDGLWTSAERTEKFAGARDCGALIDLRVFDVPFETLWARLRRRNQRSAAGAYPMTEEELRWAWELFEAPTSDELAAVDFCTVHTGGETGAASR